MTILAATLGPSAYWYLARATGAVALVLLTLSVVLGVLGTLRFSAGPRWPRFAIESLHRDVSLLAVALIVVHVVTSVLDGFAPITLLDGVIPFRSPYRPLWLGLGAVSFDLMLAVVISSLARRRLGYSSWRAIHWLAYASWPIAVLHGLGTGSDVKSWWMELLTALCVAAVVIAVLARIGRAPSATPGVRSGATALSVATPIALVIFALAGPLQSGWARRAGTPARLLGARPPARPLARPPAPGGRAESQGPGGRGLVTRTPAKGPLDHAFTASLSGAISQTSAAGGAIVQLSLRLGGAQQGRMRIRMGGEPLPGGGLQLTGSQVDLTAPGMPSAMIGQVTSLTGDRIEARVTDASGSTVDLHVALTIDQSSGAVTGALAGAPVSGRESP